MPKRLLLHGLLTSVIQTLTYCLGLIITWCILRLLDKQYEYLPTAGFAVLFCILLFAIFVTLQNIITTIVNKKWLTLLLFILTTCLISLVELYCLIDWKKEYSLRIILNLIAGLMALIIKFPIDTFLKKWTDKNSGQHD